MTVPSFELRNVTINARTGIGSDGPALWIAQIVVGLLNRPGEQNAPAGPPHDIFRAGAVRVLAQDTHPGQITVNGNAQPGHHAPRLIQAAVRARDTKTDSGQPTSTLTVCGGGNSPGTAATTELDPHIASFPVPPYSDVLLGLNDTIKSKLGVEIELPEVTLESGAIATLLRLDTGGVAKWLGIATGSPNKIFGARSNITISTLKIGPARYLPAWLVPEGIEFDASLPDPFVAPPAGRTPAPAPLKLRLLLSYDAALSQFVLRPGTTGESKTGDAQLRASFDVLMAQFGGNGTPLLTEVEPNGLPFAWSLGPGVAGGSLDATTPLIYIDPDAIRVRLNSDAPDGSVIPTVCQLKVRSAHIATSDRKLIIDCDSSSVAPNLAAATGPSDNLVTATFAWEQGSAGSVSLTVGKTAPQVIDTVEFEQRLRKRYNAAGLNIDPQKPVYAFLPLERGVLQLPLPVPPVKKVAPPIGVDRSAFSGLIRSHMQISTNRDDVTVEVTAAIGAKIVVTLAGSPATTTATFVGARGTATGLLFAAAASPSPTAILPPLDTGPIACEPLDIVFGDSQISSALSVKNWEIAPAADRPGKLNITIVSTDLTDDIIVWRGHPRMALVSTMPMTRTRFDATKPSATRDLVPFTIAAGKPREFVLSTVLDDANRSPFPELGAFDAGAFSISHDPVWPWPNANQDKQTIGEANDDISNVSASSLTLPGLEVTLDTADWSKLKTSLRYDLPILGELFASATLPKAPAAAGPQASDVTEHAPTALEPEALTEHWKLTANRHALSRTINDRATDWITMGPAPSGMLMTTFVEPYSFIPAFGVTMESSGLPLGAYSLFGKTVAGGSALAGWSGALTTPGGIAIDIVGFSARLYKGTAGAVAAQFDTRGIGQAITPRTLPLLPGGLIELRDIARVDLNNGTFKQTSRVTLTAAHIGLRFADADFGLRLRDLPMTDDGHGNLSFTPTTLTADNSRELTGPEGDLGPDGSVFERAQLSDAMLEWNFYKTANAADTPSFVFQLGALNVRPLRLACVNFVKEPTGLKLSGFEIIANVEPPSSAIDSGGPFDDDAPYSTGNPVAFRFGLDATGGVATLAAVHPVRVENRTILIGAAATAAISFPVIAKLTYGAVDGQPEEGAESRAHGSLPVVLDMNLSAAGGTVAQPLTINSAAVSAVLFGSPVRIPFGAASLNETLNFNFQAALGPETQLQVSRVSLIWSRVDIPVLMLCVRLRLPGAVTANKLPAGTTRDLVDWQVGATLRWFGTNVPSKGLADGDYFNFDADHDKGTITLSIFRASLAADAAFIQGWPIAKASLTLALAVALSPPKTPALFPTAPTAGFVEVTCDVPDGPYIRHRSVTPGQADGHPSDWNSRILVSLQNVMLTSAIAWPIEGLSATFPNPFAANSRLAADWRQDIKLDGANAYAHKLTVVVRDAELPAENLLESGGAVTLGAPWTFPALATHTLNGGSIPIVWTSVDEIVVGHVSALEREAVQTLDAPPGELGYVARYRDSVVPDLQAFAVSAAVFSKAMARAGIPTLELLISLRLATIARAASGAGAVASAAASDLFIAGAALIEVAAETDDTTGHRVVTPWLAPFFDSKALGVLSSIPQAPWNGQVSSYDLTPHARGRLDRETVIPFGTSDASVASIKRYRERIAGSLPLGRVPHFEPVSQAIIADVELPNDGADPAQWLSRPIWLRTLAAWKGILDTHPVRPLCDSTVTVTPIFVGDPKISLRTTAVRLALRRTVDDQPVGTEAVAATGLTWQAGSSYEVIVLTRNSVTVVAVANDDAKTLNESQQPIDGEERKRLATLALSVPDEPLAAALGQLTDVPANLLTDDQKRHRTHRVSGFLELPAYLDAVRQPHRLRDRLRTVFPSSALAWPRASVRASWNGKPQPAALVLGDQRPLQDAQYSWAGDVRSFSVTGAAPTLEVDAVFHHASVLSVGQRALFRRPADEDLTAPPDRALIPVPSRARVPDTHSIELALKPLRLQGNDSKLEAAIASIQPSQFEIVATGRRPGVLVYQYDGLSFANGDESFDAHQPRFGRPADRGPVVFRQTRAPRSTAYQSMDDLSRRRQTFIGSDYLDAAGHLLPFALAKGSMTALRSLGGDGPAAEVETILLRLAKTDTSPFSISGEWDGTLKLTATLYASDGPTAKQHLTDVGLTTASIVLVINGTRLSFPTPPDVGAAIANPHFKPHTRDVSSAFDVPITLKLAAGSGSLAQSLLQSADADSSATLIFSLPVKGPSVPAGVISDIQSGPPRLLSMPVPIAPYRQPSLHIETATLAFGDPAYDREISSKTASANQQSDKGTYLLALDRLEYDLAASIYFAAGRVVTTSLNDKVGKDPVWDAPEQMLLQLGVLRKSTPAAVRPSPLAVANCNTLKASSPPQHQFGSGLPYAIALADLLEAVPNKNDDWKAGYTLQAPSPPLVAGDRIVVTAIWPAGSMEVAVTIVVDPVLPPPAAVYGLATLDQDMVNATRLTSSLFATAPLPQIVEFQDLAGDLAKGLVRRRALFVWPFCPRTAPADGKPYGALVKFDRTGGGQLPNVEADFQPLLF